jgi:hypothetical protein
MPSTGKVRTITARQPPASASALIWIWYGDRKICRHPRGPRYG